MAQTEQDKINERAKWIKRVLEQPNGEQTLTDIVTKNIAAGKQPDDETIKAVLQSPYLMEKANPFIKNYLFGTQDKIVGVSPSTAPPLETLPYTPEQEPVSQGVGLPQGMSSDASLASALTSMPTPTPAPAQPQQPSGLEDFIKRGVKRIVPAVEKAGKWLREETIGGGKTETPVSSVLMDLLPLAYRGQYRPQFYEGIRMQGEARKKEAEAKAVADKKMKMESLADIIKVRSDAGYDVTNLVNQYQKLAGLPEIAGDTTLSPKAQGKITQKELDNAMDILKLGINTNSPIYRQAFELVFGNTPESANAPEIKSTINSMNALWGEYQQTKNESLRPLIEYYRVKAHSILRLNKSPEEAEKIARDAQKSKQDEVDKGFGREMDEKKFKQQQAITKFNQNIASANLLLNQKREKLGVEKFNAENSRNIAKDELALQKEENSGADANIKKQISSYIATEETKFFDSPIQEGMDMFQEGIQNNPLHADFIEKKATLFIKKWHERNPDY